LSFQQRSEVDQLRMAADGGGAAVLGQVLTGAGGVGKTQLAADYARTAWNGGEVDVLVWINASSRSAITAGYAQAGVEVLAADPSDQDQAARAFLAWLEPKANQKPCRWLIVLDDLADPADIRGWWPPTSLHGRVLVTTRRREAALTGAGRRLVTVGLFTPQEAAAYFTAVFAAHGRHEPAEQVACLAADLGHLPLALAQAAAYIIDADLTCASYRELMADRIRKLADLLPEPGALPDDQTATVAATWSLSIERADKERAAGLARPMLELAAFLDPNGIPSSVLTSAPALTYLSEHRNRAHPATARRARWRLARRHRKPVATTADEAVSALQALHRLSLIDLALTAGEVRVHQLVQRTTRDALTPQQRRRLGDATADALTAVWPVNERDIALARALRTNAAALIHHSEDTLYQKDRTHPVLHHLGLSLARAGQVAAAVDHFEHVVSTATHRLGPNNPTTLAARANLAACRGDTGDVAGAATAFAELLADREQVLGRRHPDILATRNNLASYLGEAGDAAGAVRAFAELLPDIERVHGPDHPTTLTVQHNLALWRGEAGDAAGAANAHRELLERAVRMLGPDHRTTINIRNNVARWLGEAGDAAGAATAYDDLVPDVERIFGPDHPDTLAMRNNAALWHGRAGDAAGAARAFAELLPDIERVLGPDHPDTLSGRNNLGLWRGEAGDAAGAVRAFAELLPDAVRVLGPDHPTTLAVRGNLATWRGAAGDLPGAVTAFAELLPDIERVLGPDHPTTLTFRGNLALWRGKAGDSAGAVTAFAGLLTAQERVLGADHAHTLATRIGLATSRGEAGDAAGAARAFAELLPDVERVLGPDHPASLRVRTNLTRWRGEAEDRTVDQPTD
jgi:hypothetical protein